MQNVYRCIYDYDGKQAAKFIQGSRKALRLFKVTFEDDRFVLTLVDAPTIKNKNICLIDIKGIELSLSTGVATMVTINRATIYQIDLNLKLQDGQMITLEFRSYRFIIELIKRLKQLGIDVNDPMNLLDIISTGDRWAIDKYFSENLIELKKRYMIEENRKMNRYINE